MRQCKTCESTLRDEIDALIMNGARWSYIVSWCSDRGLNITETALRNHAKAHIKGYEAPKTHEVKKAPSPKKLAKFEPEPTLINFEKYCESVGLDLDSLDDIDNHITAAQQAATLLFFRLNAIADAKLKHYERGKTKFPTEQIKALKISYEVYANAVGLEQLVDVNAAMKTLEALGFQITKGFVDVKSVDD